MKNEEYMIVLLSHYLNISPFYDFPKVIFGI